VVGRFVEEQDVGRAHQGARQLQAHAPAAGKAVDRVVQLGNLEAETEDQRLGARFGVMLAGIVERHVGFGHAHTVVAGFGVMHFVAGGEQFGIAVDDEVGRALLGFRHVLGNLAHLPLPGNRIIPAILMQRAVEQREQRRFAGPVAADQADLLTRVDGDGGLVEQHFRAAAQGDVLEDDHGRNFRMGRA